MFQAQLKVFLEKIQNNKFKKNIFIFVTVVAFIIISFYFINNNEKYYNKTVAKITSVNEQTSKTIDMNGNTDENIVQKVTAVIMNGSHRGQKFNFENKTSYSNANDIYLKPNDEIFISFIEDKNNNITYVNIIDFKRDSYLYYIVTLFVLCAVLIGGFKGFKSLVSLTINIFIILAVVALYLNGCNLLIITSLASILFIVISIFLVSGINRKSYSAIVSTMVGTLVTMIITFVVIKFTKGQGIHYEEMEFLTHPADQIFFPEILIGTLGAIMDIAISITSSIKEIYDKNPLIERKALMKSGMEIGKDIMGTMSNTLLFAYISGSMPILLIWIKNSFPILYIISFNLNLEIIRALIGSIGIVISIPITLYISVILINKPKIGEY